VAGKARAGCWVAKWGLGKVAVTERDCSGGTYVRGLVGVWCSFQWGGEGLALLG
jgi:hypothetical protein